MQPCRSSALLKASRSRSALTSTIHRSSPSNRQQRQTAHEYSLVRTQPSIEALPRLLVPGRPLRRAPPARSDHSCRQPSLLFLLICVMWVMLMNADGPAVAMNFDRSIPGDVMHMHTSVSVTSSSISSCLIGYTCEFWGPMHMDCSSQQSQY